jgi:hypothetical protein
MDKHYVITFNEKKEFWDEGMVSAMVMNEGTSQILDLDAAFQLEDCPDSAYPALSDEVLQVVHQEIVPLDGEGQVAQAILQVNPVSEQRQNLLQHHRQFRVRMVLQPKIQQADGSLKTLRAVGETQITVERPQLWQFNLSKTGWLQSEPIKLKTLPEADLETLRRLGLQGGQLIARPLVTFHPEGGAPEVRSSRPIRFASACSLDMGFGEVIAGEWNASVGGYIFQVPADLTREEAAQPAGAAPVTYALDVPVELEPDAAAKLRALHQESRLVGTRLKVNLLDDVNAYIQQILDILALKTSDELTTRDGDLKAWVNNTAQFMTAMGYAPSLIERALGLFNQVFERFVGNLIGFIIEAIFTYADAKGFFKAAKEAPAKEVVADQMSKMVRESSEAFLEEIAEETARKQARQQALEMSQGWIDDMVRGLDDLGKAGLDNAGDVASWMAKQNRQLSEMIQAQEELLLLESQSVLGQYIRDNAEQITSSSFRELLEAQVRTLPRNARIQKLVRDIQEIYTRNAPKLAMLEQKVAELAGEGVASGSAAQMQAILETLPKSETWVDGVFNIHKGELVNMWVKSPVSKKLAQLEKSIKQAQEEASQLRYHVTDKATWQEVSPWMGSIYYYVERAISILYDTANAILAFVDWIAWLLGWVLKKLSWVPGFLTAVAMKLSRNASRLQDEVYRHNRAEMVMTHGVPRSFFSFPNESIERVQRTDLVAQAVELNGNTPAERQGMLNAVMSGFVQETKMQQKAATGGFVALCKSALRPDRLENPAPPLIEAETVSQLWKPILEPMVRYEQAFGDTNRKIDETAEIFRRFRDMDTYQTIDSAMEWFGWGLSWLLKIIAVMTMAIGAGAAFFLAAQVVDFITAMARTAACLALTFPDVLGFQMDTLLCAMQYHRVAIEGEGTLDRMFKPQP